MPSPLRISRRALLRRTLILSASLAGGALAQGCQLPLLPGQGGPTSGTTPDCPGRPVSGSTVARAPVPVARVSAIEPLAGAPPGNPAVSHLVLVVVDGMMVEYLGLGSFPNLRRLIASGTSFERAWVGQMVNNTPVSHTTLLSGTLPNRHGVVYFYWRDPNSGKLVDTMSAPMLEGGGFAALMREAGVPSVSRTVKQHRPGSRVVSVGSTKDFAAVAMGLDAADHTGYAVRLPASRGAAPAGDQREVSPRGDVLPDKKGARTAARSGEVSPPVRSLVPGGPASAPLPDTVLCDPSLAMTSRELGDNDLFAGNLALKLFESVRPTVLLVNLPDVDQVGHLTGGHTASPAAVARAMAQADEQIGRLMEAYRAAGLFERTLWVVTSDHGMTPNGVNILPALLEDVLAGSQKALAGDTVHYWLRNPAEAPRAAAELDGHAVPGLFGTYFKVDQGSGRYVYEPTAALAARLEARPRAAFEWLLDSFVSAQSPDLVMAVGENVHVHNAPLNSIGAHSEATWLLQRIPLIFSGPGVRSGVVSGYPARLVDIAPTILALLGLPAPEMDGQPLLDVLASSDEAARERQRGSAESSRFRRYQDSLRELGSPR